MKPVPPSACSLPCLPRRLLRSLRTASIHATNIGLLPVPPAQIVRPSELSIVRSLGSGGSGEVFLARWHGTDVAVKCLHTACGADEVRQRKCVHTHTHTGHMGHACGCGAGAPMAAKQYAKDPLPARVVLSCLANSRQQRCGMSACGILLPSRFTRRAGGSMVTGLSEESLCKGVPLKCF